MDFSDVYNSDVRVKEEPNDVSPIENEDYMIIGNARNAKTDEFSSFCRENLIHGLREYDENSRPNNDLEIEFECKDEKLGIDLLVVKKIEDDYPDHLQYMKNSCDYQTQKKIKEEIVDEVKEELNWDGELSDAFDAHEKPFAQNSLCKTQTDKARNRTKYPCNVCGKKFSQKGHLKIHIDAVHNGVKHTCVTCKKTFAHKNTLKMHINAMHNGMAPTCEKCGKKFQTKANLKIHIDSVHNGVRHACSICEKTYVRKEDLKVHINAMHNGVKHACGVCGKTFTQKGDLKRHIEGHNGVKHTCVTCGKTSHKKKISKCTSMRCIKVSNQHVKYAEKPSQLRLHSRSTSMQFIMESNIRVLHVKRHSHANIL
ncbi:zinc finger protein 32-like [Trichogramma pretiosum]|uniref:zinc finger protein 32-like n=1 Tax=Trichogramma pretiosum TaxID=7493 RepID=UPI000C718FE8|nr:zinc finger protein 32-like [Trichogramma pretiosum]